MKIKSMEDVKNNVGKKVLFRSKWTNDKKIGKIVYGKVEDCDVDIIGYDYKYSILYDEKDAGGSTWHSIDNKDFEDGSIKLFETIEEENSSKKLSKAEELRDISNKVLLEKYGDDVKTAYEKVLNICKTYAENGDRYAIVDSKSVEELKNSFVVDKVSSLLINENLDVKVFWKNIGYYYQEDDLLNYMEITW